MEYVYVVMTVLMTVYGQLIVKWQVLKSGPFPEGTSEKVLFLINLVFNPWIISSFLAAFLAAIFWMAAMTKLELSYAYPFMSASFVLVFVFSAILFHEQINIVRIVGLAIIVIGIIVSSM